MMLFDRLRTTRFLSSLNVRTQFKSLSGLFRLATQTTFSGLNLYHIPKYLYWEFSGVKNPSSKLWPEETNLSPFLMD
ncbi:hypothetical protein EUGRSUZ_F00851 [Eucalyptus grandis]|uniref:Uncharacterized protein n=2 Tax=Eucalyptus grandis TaxID=71139 RepID=A0ACC3KC78_EUCGR|nr:hypothetical protein EUGRSUZ_F00851 [Eucalyptus grandis]